MWGLGCGVGVWVAHRLIQALHMQHNIPVCALWPLGWHVLRLASSSRHEWHVPRLSSSSRHVLRLSSSSRHEWHAWDVCCSGHRLLWLAMRLVHDNRQYTVLGFGYVLC
jgi:hypothetical protein